MRLVCVITAVAAISVIAAEKTNEIRWSFEDAGVGKVPHGWSSGKTGEGSGSVWKVLEDTTAPSGTHVLAQTSSKGPNRMFNLCVCNEATFTDVDIRVSFKAVAGKIDQGGGPVWRYRDENNYYIARMNPLEDNFRVYKVVEGKRTQLDSSDVEAPAGKWHAIHVVQRGNHILCFLNGEALLDVKDETFQGPGKIGLWTKADAVTSFADVTVRVPEKRESTAGGREVLLWQSRHTTTPPNVDGVADKVWRIAEPLTVVVREAVGGHNPKSVILRALHTDDTLYVLAHWPDATRSDMRDPYVWNANQKNYERPSKPDDQFALEFPIKGDFHVNMLAMSRDYTADVWHWKAGRGNPVGWVDDKRHIISQKQVPEAREYSMGGRGKVYIARLMDGGTSSYTLKPQPTTFQGKVLDSYQASSPSGSLADVRGKGVHAGKTWTLEMSRKFKTGHDDDAVIYPHRDNICAIAVLDDELYWHHSVSPPIILRFASDK